MIFGRPFARIVDLKLLDEKWKDESLESTQIGFDCPLFGPGVAKAKKFHFLSFEEVGRKGGRIVSGRDLIDTVFPVVDLALDENAFVAVFVEPHGQLAMRLVFCAVSTTLTGVRVALNTLGLPS